MMSRMTANDSATNGQKREGRRERSALSFFLLLYQMKAMSDRKKNVRSEWRHAYVRTIQLQTGRREKAEENVWPSLSACFCTKRKRWAIEATKKEMSVANDVIPTCEWFSYKCKKAEEDDCMSKRTHPPPERFCSTAETSISDRRRRFQENRSLTVRGRDRCMVTV